MLSGTDRYFSINEGSLLGFPITPYTAEGRINEDALASHIDMLLSYGAEAIFAACGTGEMQCLSLDEHERVIDVTVQAAAGRVPVFAAAGFGLDQSIAMIDRAQRCGADGVLAFPPYLSGTDDETLYTYYANLAERSSLPVVIYQRDAVRFSPSVLGALSRLTNIVGLKDGSGEVDLLQRQIREVTDPRFVYFNGTPTAELFAPAMAKAGVRSYSSALLNVVPEFAAAFNSAFRAGDSSLQQRLIDEVVIPFVDLRDRRAGYAVALVKAGVAARGSAVGDVRAPLLTVTDRDYKDLLLWLEALDLAGPLRPRTTDAEPWVLPSRHATPA
jgi:5-dehydro-4-deoxyglucarate dehydratase